MSRRLIVILVLVILAIAALVVAVSQFYPAALVDWRPVNLDSFNRESAAVIHYYQKVAEVYGENALPFGTGEFKKEIQKAVLDKMIEDRVVARALESKLKESEIEEIVSKKINELMASAGSDIGEKVATLYGISMADFRKEILEPQARLETLEGRFIIENNSSLTFDEWLASLKNGSNVSVFVPGFCWKDGKVALSE
jgi:tetrahydromethanopterin S-methyltransferase subunit G